MKAPSKLIDSGAEASAFVKELLREGRAESLPVQAKAAIWKGIVVNAPGALSTSAGTSAAAGVAKGATAATVLKGTVMVAALAGGIWGSHRLVTSSRSAGRWDDWRPVAAAVHVPTAHPERAAPVPRSERPGTEELPGLQERASSPGPSRRHETPGKRRGGAPTTERPSAAATAAGAVSAPTGAISATAVASVSDAPAETADAAEAPVLPPPEPSRPPSRTLRGSRLAEESQLVLEARQGLRAGHVAAVFRQLEAAKARFSGGALVQEREALAIEALWGMGEREAARARVTSFSRAYPESPYVSQLRQLTRP